MLTSIDLFLLEGTVALVRTCLGILSAIQCKASQILFSLVDVLDLTYEETLVYMKTFVLPDRADDTVLSAGITTSSSKRSLLWAVTTDCQTFYSNALRQFPINRSLLASIEEMFWT
jgi:hypothetical protein